MNVTTAGLMNGATAYVFAPIGTPPITASQTFTT